MEDRSVRFVRVAFVIMILTGVVAATACVPDDQGDDENDSNPIDPDGEEVDYGCLPAGLEIPETIDVEREGGKVETLDMDDYVSGVVYLEMGPDFPKQAILAQGIAARTFAAHWALYRDEPICDTTSCQVYGDERDPLIDELTELTSGVVAIYEEDLIEAVYHASSGGFTENAKDVWGNPFDYLVGVPCLENALCTGVCDAWPDEVCIYGDTGCCWGRNGHGVGMSQRGAQAMAECEYNHAQILKHYYSGIELAKNCEE